MTANLIHSLLLGDYIFGSKIGIPDEMTAVGAFILNSNDKLNDIDEKDIKNKNVKKDNISYSIQSALNTLCLNCLTKKSTPSKGLKGANTGEYCDSNSTAIKQSHESTTNSALLRQISKHPTPQNSSLPDVESPDFSAGGGDGSEKQNSEITKNELCWAQFLLGTPDRNQPPNRYPDRNQSELQS